jgi:biopolymer transport protein ExbD
MKSAKDKKGSGPRLDMTPMIDVVFLLLIFFVVVFKQDDILSTLAAAKPGTDELVEPTREIKEINLLSIDVTAAGFALNGKSVNRDELDGKLKKYSRISTESMITVKCTPDSSHGLLVQALDLCSKHGMRNVSVFSRR